jgi:hypothetical protein
MGEGLAIGFAAMGAQVRGTRMAGLNGARSSFSHYFGGDIRMRRLFKVTFRLLGSLILNRFELRLIATIPIAIG